MPPKKPFDDQETTHFGYADVTLGEKQGLVDDVFGKGARRSGVTRLRLGGLGIGRVDTGRRPLSHAGRGAFIRH